MLYCGLDNEIQRERERERESMFPLPSPFLLKLTSENCNSLQVRGNASKVLRPSLCSQHLNKLRATNPEMHVCQGIILEGSKQEYAQLQNK